MCLNEKSNQKIMAKVRNVNGYYKFVKQDSLKKSISILLSPIGFCYRFAMVEVLVIREMRFLRP
jgi:hypothetical protein